MLSAGLLLLVLQQGFHAAAASGLTFSELQVGFSENASTREGAFRDVLSKSPFSLPAMRGKKFTIPPVKYASHSVSERIKEEPQGEIYILRMARVQVS